MVSRQLIPFTMAVLLVLPAAAEDLQLPQTPEHFRELLEESASRDEPKAKAGRIMRITRVSSLVRGAPVDPNPTLQSVAGGGPTVQPVPLVGKNVREESARQKDERHTRYEISIRWSDGSIGVFEQDNVDGLLEGDFVVVRGRTVEHDRSR